MKRIMLITLFLLLFIGCSAVHAENSMDDTIAADNTFIDESNDVDLSESLLEKASDSDDANNLYVNESVLADADEGEYVDASEAYDYLNAFRTEENVWYWNADDSTQSHVNTNDTVWLKPLLRDVELENTAKIRAKEISQYFSHERPDGTMCFAIFPDGLLDYGENIAYGYEDSFAVTEGWKETDLPYDGQGHRRTMLQASFNYVGIAGYKVDGIIYWVQNFGCRYDPKDVSAVSRLNFENNTANPKFSVELPSYASGSFEVQVNGIPITVKSVSNGNAEITVCGLAPGSYDVFLSYSGDYNCNPLNRSQTVVIPDYETPSGALTFNHLNTMVVMAENEIRLENDYVYSPDTDSSLAQGIEINKGLIIDGQGHTIDAGNLARIFRVNSFDVTFKNIRMINANSNFPDEKRYYDDSAYGVTAYSNSRPNMDGGAIYSDSTISIINSTFSNNTALNGGAIYSFSQVHISNSSFTDNGAGDDGGAIYSWNDVFITNTNFTDNWAVDLGGAVRSLSTIDATDSVFKNNYNFAISARQFISNNNMIVNEGYGDLFANASIRNGIVTLNGNYDARGTVLINASNVVIDGRGYTIDAKNRSRVFNITGDNVTIKNIRIINGKSTGNGGAIHVSSSFLTIMNSTFENCIGQSGGAIYGNLTNITVIGSTFASNTVDDFAGSKLSIGGAICTDNGTVSVSDSSFINNLAFDGGAISVEYAFVSIHNSHFENNSASVYGGGAISSAIGVNITDSIFIGNYANRYGGAIFCYEQSKTHIRNSIFENNTSNHYGGAVTAAVWAEIIDSLFTGNRASNHAGAIALWGNLTVNNSNFTRNSAQTGGVIFDLSNVSTVSITNSNFINNTQKTYGAVYITNNAFVSDCSFINNHASDGVGGAIVSCQSIIVSNSIFKNNSAVRSWGYSLGGAIVNYGQSLNVVNSIFTDNSAHSGGAILNFAGNATVDGSSFANNSAQDGGACFKYNTSSIFVSNSNFENNSAEFGGALYVCDAFNCTFTQNSAPYGASAMYGDLNTAEKCDFIRNIDYADGPTYGVTTTDCTFKDNRHIVRAYFNTYFMGSEYYQQDRLYMYLLNSQNSFHLSNATVTLRAYKNNVLVGKFEFLSSEGWIVNITEGNYTFQFSAENQDYEADPVNATVTIIKKEVVELNIQMGNNTYLDVTAFNITSNLDGSITVYFDDYYWDDLNILANETLHVEYNYISAGNHTFKFAITPADYHVDSNTFAKNFTVFKKQTSIILNVENTTDMDVAVVKLNSSDYGNVIVRVGSIEDNTYLTPGVETVVSLGMLDAGTYTVVATYPGDENFAGSNASKTFKVFRQLRFGELSVSQNGLYVRITLPEDLTGNVTFSIAGENCSVNVIKGIADVMLPDLDEGYYLYEIAYVGDDKYGEFHVTDNMFIQSTKIVKTIPTMDVSGFVEGIAQATLPSDATGTVTLTINGNNYEFDVMNGVANLILPNLENGNYVYVVSYSGDEQYESVIANGTVYINNLVEPEIAIPPLDEPSSDGSVTVSLPSDATGTVTLTVNDQNYTFDVKDGSANIKLPDLANGNYTYIVSYSGDGKYSSFASNGVLKVNKTNPQALLIPDVTIPSLNEGLDNGYVIVSVPNDVKATVTLSISGNTYVFDVVDGKANVTLPELANGNYDYSIKYCPASKYANYTDMGILIVNKTSSPDVKPVPEIVIPPLDEPSADGSVTVTLPEDATGTVTLTINGKDYPFEVIKGRANVVIPDLADGNYPYTITYSGDEKYSSFTNTGSFNKLSPAVDPVITAKDTNVLYTANGKYSVTVYGTDGKVVENALVIFKINGKQVGKGYSNANGVATYVVKNVPGTYNIVATALNTSVTKKLTVKHVVTLKTATLKKSAKKLTLQATLAKVNGKYLKKKTVTFKINGKKVATAKTNSKGVAKVTIKNPNVVKKLKVGKKATYQATYLKDTVKKTAKVKK